ncbi:hypothetical protein AB4Y45_35090 [Paraburkholderia sp. EG287A]|uniref:hypothetical protein n=1 Tax=Paraburkholderia sp. EG287A TaxID=3237012 RepID=UPI0034D32EB1
MPLPKERPLPFAKETLVRFTDAYLLKCHEAEARRLRGRVGMVTNYRGGAVDPIVEFPRAGRFPALKLFEVRAANLEVVPKQGGAA